MLRISFVLHIVLLACINGAPQRNKYQRYLDNPAVYRFRKYLQIDTSKPENIRYAVDFLTHQANEIGLPYAIYESAGVQIVVVTLPGSDPTLQSIMLNSHMDVVPVKADDWAYPPFAADVDDNGNIFSRGAQDTKDVGMQYLEAIRILKKNNVTLARTLHVTFMPDEETGGKNGMQAFVKTAEFESLNIGFALDEGLPSVDNSLFVTFVDRRPWQFWIEIKGVGGHGLSMPDDTPMEKAYRLINSVMNYREKQKAIMRTKAQYDYTGYNSVNINIIRTGLAVNIIPSSLELAIDMRLSPETDAAEIDALIKSWMEAAGNGTELRFKRRLNESAVTSVDDTNPYWVTMRNTLNNMKIRTIPVVMTGTTDMVYVRNRGIPSFGFSAKTNTVPKVHTENEYLNVLTFLKGIDIYTEVIKNLVNVPPHISTFLE